MKESMLWKRIESRYGAKLRARLGGSQSGAAMVMALLFILVVTAVSTLTLGILLAQALPYRNNSMKTQANYAAETGLQAALSFLRKADTTGDASGLFPSSGTSATSAATMVTDTGVVRTFGAVKVDQTAGGTAISYTPRDVHYRLSIVYYDGNPTSGGTEITDPSQVTKITYAVVTSRGYVGSTSITIKTTSGIYKFGWSPRTGTGGGRSGSAAFYGKALQLNNHDAWILAKSYDASREILTVKDSEWNWYGLAYESNPPSGMILQDPRYQTCMVASTDSVTGNVDPSKEAVEGAPIRLFRIAPQTDNGEYLYIQYSQYCNSSGIYKKLNSWVYGADDSIRLAGTDLCVTGKGDTVNMPATLEKCGTGYSPAVNGASAYATTYAQKEADDPNSLLNKNQKWAFYYGFMNAKKVVRDSKTYYQSLFGYRGQYQNFLHGGASGEASGVCDTSFGEQFTDGDKACYLISTKWQNPRMANDWANNENTFSASSLGMAGESGYQTNQIVSSTGYCFDSRYNRNSGKLTSLPCNVNALPLDPVCEYNAGCHDAWARDGQTFFYSEAASATDANASTAPTLTSITTHNRDGSSSLCLTVQSSEELSMSSGDCTARATDSSHSFYRFGYVGKDSKFNYKFVVASTVNPANPDASTNPICITQMTPEDPSFDYKNHWSDPTIAYMALRTCTASTMNNRGQETYPQEWNAPETYTSGSDTSGSGSSTSGMTPGTGMMVVTKQLQN